MGDRVQRTDPENRVTEWRYDLRRRQLSETRKMLPSDDGDDETEVSCYDGNGNRVARYLPAAVAALALSGSMELCASLPAGGWRYGYDGANRLVSVADPLLNETTYGYDGSGNRTSQTDANEHTTSFEYDELERLTKKLYPEVAGLVAEEGYGYDENGNRAQLVDPKGLSFAWQFDELDRETLASYPLPATPRGDDLLSIDTTYDENANPLQIVETRAGPPGEETRTTVFNYDDFDRVLTKTDPWSKKLTYGYDPAGNRTRLTDPDGKTTLYAFDELNRLTAATLPNGGGVTNYEHFKNGLLRKISYPNGAIANHTYDLANRIQRIENKQFTAISSSYEYNYDENGNRTQQTEQNGGAPEITSYEYDDADRLTHVNYPDQAVEYTLDGVGNRTNEVTNDTATSTVISSKLFTYNERDWLTSIADSANSANDANYSYDLAGNQIARTQGGVATGFIYDTRDQLVEVQTDGTLVESYDFSYDGLRMRKSGSGSLFRYVYDGRSLLLETDLGGNTISKYEWGSDRLISLNHATEGRTFYLFDALGSPVSLSKPDGTLQARYLWDAWGNLRSEVGASSSIFGFTGYQRDDVTRLYYAGARFYQPEIGRFVNEDPFGGEPMTPPSLHRYFYAYGSPARYTDPLGMYSFDEFTRDLAFGADVAVNFYSNVYDPRNAVKNAQRAVGGAFGVAKFAGESAIATASLVADNSPLAILIPSAQARNVERVKAIGQVLSHPIDSVKTSTSAAIAKIEEHEAKGEYVQSGIAGGEFGAEYGSALLGGAEAGVGLARSATRLARNISTRNALNSASKLDALPVTIGEDAAGVGVRAAPTASAGIGGAASPGELAGTLFERYQGFVDDAHAVALRAEAAGKLKVPAGVSRETYLGQMVDKAARDNLRAWLKSEGVSEGPTGTVQVNRRLYSESRNSFRVPDVRVKDANVVFDATIGKKTAATPQVRDFVDFSDRSHVTIVRPMDLGGSYSIWP